MTAAARPEAPGSAPGTYALFFTTPHRRRVRIGRLGELDLEPGVYVYIGSAFGPGGLAARIGRHRRVAKPRRWHLDHLRPWLHLAAVWWTEDPGRRECQWARLLHRLEGEWPLRGFGSSDCGCRAHLVKYASRLRPSFEAFRQVLGELAPDHQEIKHLDLL